MKESIEVKQQIQASRQSAWALLADFGNPHHYVSNILGAHLTTGVATGIGATRHCDLPSMMGRKQYIVEEITEWVEGESFTYVITDTSAPITDSDVLWSVTGDDGEATISVTVAYRPKGLLGKMMAPVLRRQFASTLREGLLDMKRKLEAGREVPAERRAGSGVSSDLATSSSAVSMATGS